MANHAKLSFVLCVLVALLFSTSTGGVSQIPRRSQTPFIPRKGSGYSSGISFPRQLQQPPIRSLLIDNYDSYTYNVWQLLAEVNGAEPYVVYNDAFDGKWENLLKEVPSFDNIVISPGPGSPEYEEDFGLCADAIRYAKVPLLGVCLGHQGMAHVYGGKVVRAPQPMHGRLSPLQHKQDSALLSQIPIGSEVVRYHSLAVDISKSSELRPTAWTNDGTVMAMEHVTKPQYGVQFHPESIRTGAGRQMLTNFRDITKLHRSAEHDKRRTVEKQGSFWSPTSSAVKESIADNYHVGDTDLTDTFSKQVSESRIKREVLIFTLNPSQFATVSKATTETVFKNLYGDHPAAFWLDSESPGPQMLGTMKENNLQEKKRFSFMGAVDTSSAFVSEYNGDHLMFIRHLEQQEIRNQSLFQFLRERFEEEAVTDTSIRYVPSDKSASVVEGLWNIPVESSNLPPFNLTSTLFGYLGYELGAEASSILSQSSTFGDKFDLSKIEEDVLSTSSHLQPHHHHQLETTSSTTNSNSRSVHTSNEQPLSVLMHPSRFITYDHIDNLYYIVSIASTDTSSSEDVSRQQIEKAYEEGQELVMRLRNILETSEEDVNDAAADRVSGNIGAKENFPVLHAWKSKDAYKKDINSCLEYIGEGETYEVCLTVQFKGTAKEIDYKNPLETYRTLRRFNPAPYACFLRYDPVRLAKSRSANQLPGLQSWYTPGGFAVCSTSPECYLRALPDGHIQSKPIKGTAKRDLKDSNQDLQIRYNLDNDEKSQAENLMIVDLVRNDLGRVCKVGSVHVPKLMDIESFATVHQMVSTVAGNMRDDRDLVDALIATFPGGSMTGAPKLRTLNIISELEGHSRGIYSGTIGYIGFNGAADLNIVIRTALLADGKLTLGAGGAIVAMSNPEEEVEEVLTKAQSVSRALGYRVEFPPNNDK